MKKFLLLVLILVVCISALLLLKQKKTEPSNFEEDLTGKVVLYFKGDESLKLEKEYRNVSMKRIKEDIGKTIVEELLKGPTSDNLKSTIPVNTKLINIEMDGSRAIVNISKEFVDNQTGNSEDCLLAIYSIVNSLTEITEIEEVKFLVEGHEIENYKGFYDMTKPFVRSVWF